MHRALRRDVGWRFVEVGPGDGYEVVYEEGEPEGEGGVILITPFEVPREEHEEFLSGWHAIRDRLAVQRGYLGTRLHRSVSDHRFVEITRWSSPLMVQRATQKAEFQELAATLPWPSHPALYEIIRR